MLSGSTERRNSPISIPDNLWDVRYNSAPGAPNVQGIVGGANCQQYAYTVLRHFGFGIPDFRSSDLWEDILHTRTASSPIPFDLVLVHNRRESYGAHVGVYVGDGLVLHLSRQIDASVLETLNEMRSREQYRHLIGFKTVLTRRLAECREEERQLPVS